MSVRPRTSWIDHILLAGVVVAIAFAVWKHGNIETASLPAKVKTVDVKLPTEIQKEHFSASDMASFQKIKALHSTGDYAGALKTAQDLMESTSIEPIFRSWLTRQMGALMASAGWLLIRTGDCGEALKIFYKAVRLYPVPETRKGLGYCLHMGKNWPEAASWLAGYVLEAPGDADARVLYADCLESLGRFEDAVSMLEGALALKDVSLEHKKVLEQRLQAMKVKAREGTRQKSEYSRRFFVSFREGDHESLLTGIFDTLENGLDEFSELLGIPASEAPVEVVLYRQEAFHEVIPGGPAWSEGVFDGRIRVPVSDAAKRDPGGLLGTILRHELVHALLHLPAAGRILPAWFDEGLAQYLSCRGRPCAGFRFAPTPAVFSDKAFLMDPFVTLSSIDAGRAYSHSLYLLRLMIHQNGEEILRRVGPDFPRQGPLSSDIMAKILGNQDFESLVAAGREQYGALKSF
ncbi:MAG: tetratricopeptide repeat protein [Proteobacteria bacterium]|nr:tetratricopeptide repeat protein [Pseudomonadota bacterium]